MEFKLDLAIYPFEAVLNASFVFIERSYIFFKSFSPGKSLTVVIKPKGNTKIKSNLLFNEFKNELLRSTLRCVVSNNNKKIRDYIIGRALFYDIPSPDSLLSSPKKNSYKNDPLGITKAWNEKKTKKPDSNKI